MLTPSFVASVKVTTRTDFPDGTVGGLVLRVTPNGIKTWCLRYRSPHGTPKRYTLGSTAILTVSQARTRARQTLHAIAAGADPALEKRSQRTPHTLEELVADYLRLHAIPKNRSWKQAQWKLNHPAIKPLYPMPVKAITRRDIRAMLQRAVDCGAPVVANRLLTTLRTLFNFGIQHDWIEHNPASQIPFPTVEHSRDRVLTEAEIRALWDACEDEPPIHRAFHRLRLLTAQRGGELRTLRWADLDEDGRAFEIPASIAKNGRAHRVPLSLTAQALIAELPRIEDNPFIFQGPSGALTVKPLQVSFQRVHVRAGAMLKLLHQAKPEPFRGHDLRRTAATGMARCGIPQGHIAAVLNHTQAGAKVTAVYQRYEFDKEKRIALETWDRELQRILSDDQKTGTVTPFRR